MKTRVAIAGASGYSGQELVRLLEKHPTFELVARVGRDDKASDLKGKAELVFLCTPAEVSLDMAPQYLDAGLHVVDVSGAFRLKKFPYAEWYGLEHTAPAWLRAAEYGLYPYLKPKVAQKNQPRLISNPGCYATAVILALVPLLKSGLVDSHELFVDAKSGTTGAGRKGDTRLLFSEIFGEFAPYKVGQHQHWPEIVEAVATHAGVEIHPVFITELLPVARGISAAVFGRWNSAGAADPERLEKLLAAYRKDYGPDSDIHVGTDVKLSSMKSVVDTNRVHIQVQEAFGKPVLFSVLDNLLRGAAGQALMNANQLFARPALEGLT